MKKDLDAMQKEIDSRMAAWIARMREMEEREKADAEKAAAALRVRAAESKMRAWHGRK